MLIPLGHEQTSVRRLPWVTFGIMVLCILAYVLTLAGTHEGDPRQRLDEVAQYYMSHPYLELDPGLKGVFFHGKTQEEQEAFREAAKHFAARPDDPADEAAEQRQLDQLTERFFAAVVPAPYREWGLIPAKIHVLAFITYMFMHAGLLHLLGNLFFLYLAGPFIEDVWGRPLYIAFYLAAGVFSAGMFALRYPQMEGPLIGASGAIAGVMGAFFIRYWTSRIRFFYWIGFVFRGTFSAPAWLMLPLWFLREVVWATGTDAANPEGGGGGVAYWAHVWGFAFGVAIALAVRFLRVEERFIHPAIESKITLVANPLVEEAAQLRDQGRGDDALALLRDEVRRNPDTQLMYWTLAVQQGAAGEAAPVAERLIRDALRNGDVEIAESHWRELRQHAPAAIPEPSLAARMAEQFAQQRLQEDASDALDAALAEAGPATGGAILLRLARVAAQLGSPRTAEVIRAAREHPELPPEALEELGQLEGALPESSLPTSPLADAPVPPLPSAPAIEQGTTGEEDVPPEPVIEPRVVAHRLERMDGVPTALVGDSLVVSVQGETRSVPLSRLQAVAVAGIQGSPPVLLVDLLLDGPWSDRVALRTVRLLSSSFDPQLLMPEAASTIEAFRSLLDLLLQISEAVPLPDPDAAVGRPFRMFASVAAYEQEVLGVEREPPPSPLSVAH